jgi:hypothetical protein
MKKKHFLIFAFLLVLSAMMLPELQQIFSADAVDPTALLAAGPAFAPLNWKMGQNNMGGFKSHLLFIPVGAVSSVPVVPNPDDAADNDAMVTATGSFVFKETSGLTSPIYLYSTDGQVEYKADAQGEVDGISYKQTLAFVFPGNTPSMHAFNALVKNTPGYYIFEDVDGRQMMLGQPGLPASTSPAYNGGKARADKRGTTYTATADSNYTGIYLGTPIDIEAIGNGDTGTTT